MITLVVSLFLADWQQRRWRLSRHAARSSSLWHRLTAWLDPEPYIYTREGTDGVGWQQRADDRPPIRKKHRALARLEISDALEMRGRVLAALFAWSSVVVLVLAYLLKHAYQWMAHS